MSVWRELSWSDLLLLLLSSMTISQRANQGSRVEGNVVSMAEKSPSAGGLPPMIALMNQVIVTP